MLHFKNISDLIVIILAGTGSLIIGQLLNLLFFKIYGGVTKHISNSDLITKHLRFFSRLLIIVFIFSIVIPFFHFNDNNTIKLILKFILIAYIGIFAFGFVKLTYILEEFILRKYNINIQNNLEARKIYTQTKFIKKVIMIIITLIGLSFILMQFNEVKEIGTTILASAGIIGVIIGFATQKTLNLVIAGLQIAVTQPIKIDDVLIIDGEWGRVEEISLTYVVLRIWDLRRLVIPVNYFIENSFQNWTRTSANLLGTVFIYTDYNVNVDNIRRELEAMLQTTDLWDKQAWGLQVTNTTERTLELRALMSASDSSKLWNLRCLIREKLIKFIGDKYPESLPKTRNKLSKQ